MPNLPEILVILVIIGIVFGFGKVAAVGSHLARAKQELLKGMRGEGESSTGRRDVIDITPSGDEPGSSTPKPGTRKQPIEDAEIE